MSETGNIGDASFFRETGGIAQIGRKGFQEATPREVIEIDNS